MAMDARQAEEDGSLGADLVEDLLTLRGLFCPICEEPFKDKVLQCPEGHAYCRVCWAQWLAASGGGSCPECRTPVIYSRLVRNRQLENLIGELRERQSIVALSFTRESQKTSSQTTDTAASTCRKRKNSKSAASSSSLPQFAPIPMPIPSPAAPPRHLLPARRPRKSAVPRILLGLFALIMAYRFILLSSTLIEVYFSPNPRFSMVIDVLKSLWATHFSNLSLIKHDAAKQEFLRELLRSESSQLPFVYLMKELFSHLWIFAYRLILLSFCLADTLILLSLWLIHRSTWFIVRLFVGGAQLTYRWAYYLFIERSGPLLLHQVLRCAQWIVVTGKNVLISLVEQAIG